MMKYFAYEVADESSYLLFVHTNETEMERHLITTLEQFDVETVAVGTVTANNVEDAHSKIRSVDWEYSQRV